MVKKKSKGKASAGKSRRRPAGKAGKRSAKRKTGGKRAAARRGAGKPRRAAKKPARATRKKAAAASRPRAARPARRVPGREPSAAGELYGEGNWKADEEYREGLRKFTETHDAPALARKAARDLEPDLRDSADEDVAESSRRGAEEEPEW